jgi:hypothetical protein
MDITPENVGQSLQGEEQLTALISDQDLLIQKNCGLECVLKPHGSRVGPEKGRITSRQVQPSTRFAA